MKNSFLTLLAGLLLASNAMAGGPGVISISGGLDKAAKVEGHCGASSFGYIVVASIKDKTGKSNDISVGCLESIAVPIGGLMDAGLSKDIYQASKNYIKKLAGKNVKMTSRLTTSKT